ncbi:unnamed protein product [Mytilus coruscus]|uniref:Uncharacterized protein n=1 Tax=Mytilus coruscus TaxID=42192 RepID=A0A6J8DCL7_MYTCO|nr:unnamed protein product [Mytilus coruscus]
MESQDVPTRESRAKEEGLIPLDDVQTARELNDTGLPIGLNLYTTKKRQTEAESSCTQEENMMKETALAELVTYISETQRNSEESVVFRLTDLANLYDEKLTQLGFSTAQVQSERLKGKVLQKMSKLKKHTKGRDVLFMFEKDIGPAIAFACDYNDTMHIVHCRSAQLGEAVVERYLYEGVVCLPLFKDKVFTTAAVDNIDHHQSSISSKSSFRGTGIAIFQHPMKENGGVRRDQII